MSAAAETPPAEASAATPSAKPPTRRGMELFLLAFATVITTSALVLVEANQEQELSPQLLYYGAAMLVVYTVAHLAVRRLAPYADPLILPIAGVLNGIGLVMVHRLDLADSAGAADAPKQVAWTAIGLLLFLAVLTVVRDHRLLARYGYTAGLVGIVALALPGVLPASISQVNGAKIWLRLGPFSIQPAEFAKILLIIFFASFLVAKRDLFVAAGKRFLGMDLPRARDLAPLLGAWGLSVGVLVLEKDLGTSLLFFGTVLVLLYVATERISWLVIGLSIFVAGAWLAYQLFDHIQVRVQTWLNPFADYASGGYQLAQALFGLGTGGLLGTGLGAGRPDLVPLAQSDFIVSTIGEELGFVGLGTVVLLYLLLVSRGFRSALAVRDTFGKLLATGLAFAMALQVFVVVGGVSKLIPLTGLTLPFVSYGGSSLVANYALIALLLRISDAARRPTPASKAPQPAQHLAEANTEMISTAAVRARQHDAETGR